MPNNETPQQRIQRLRNEMSSNGTTIIQTKDKVTKAEEPQEGFIKGLVKDIANPVARLGVNVIKAGQMVTPGGKTGKESTTEDLPFFGETEGVGLKEGGPFSKENIKDSIGTGLELASFIPVVRGGKMAVEGAKGLAKKTITPLVKEGAFGGALTGAGTALQEDKELAETAFSAVTGAGVGGAFGGAFGAGAKGISKVLGAQAEKTATKELAKAGIPDARTASIKVTPEGKIKPDTVAREVIRQGVPAADIASAKSGSTIDKQKMLEMIKIRQKQMTQKTSERSTDVVGKTFIENIAKPIQKLNKDAGQKLEQVARRLQGSKVDAKQPFIDFVDTLEQAGIKFDKKLNIKSFKESDFDKLSLIQNDIKNVFNRVKRVAKTGDAYQMHRIKRYIDSIVDYGAEGKGLKGTASRMLKGVRRNIDQLLDGKFEQYNKVNTQFADTIQEMEKINSYLGRRMKLSDQFADAKLGVKMNGILSKNQSRAEILSTLKNSQEVLKKYGINVQEDIEKQAFFADTLESLIGSEAPTSFTGSIEGVVRRGADLAGTGTEAMKGNLAGAAIRGTKAISDSARGITVDNQLKALIELLEDGIGNPVKIKITNFGKKI